MRLHRQHFLVHLELHFGSVIMCIKRMEMFSVNTWVSIRQNRLFCQESGISFFNYHIVLLNCPNLKKTHGQRN